jgi:gluconolactonase
MRRVPSFLILLVAAVSAPAQDMPLSQILLDREGWRPAASGFTAIHGLTVDAEGNVYLSDPEGKGLVRLSSDGKTQVLGCNEGGLHALAWSAGRLYASQPGKKRIVVLQEKDGKWARTSEVGGVVAGDLAVTNSGERVYCTVPAEKAIYLIDVASGRKRISRLDFVPKGLVLWPHRGTLVVGPERGRHLWALRVEKDGSLDSKDDYYALRVPYNPAGPLAPRPATLPIGVGGLTVDRVGRLYAATTLGVQVYDPTGRMSGVLVPPGGPKQAAPTAVAFGGMDLKTLYVSCGDKVFARRTQAQGVGRLSGSSKR